jgi:hypothetical protein
MYIGPQLDLALGTSLAREFKGKRHALGEPLTSELIQFCNDRDMTPSKVIRRAVREYLDAHGAERSSDVQRVRSPLPKRSR